MMSKADSTGPDTGSRPIPVLATDEFSRYYIPTCLSNGIIGITPGLDPLSEGVSVCSGFVRPHHRLSHEQLAPAPYPIRITLRAAGDEPAGGGAPALAGTAGAAAASAGTAPASAAAPRISTILRRQSLDMSCGELESDIEGEGGSLRMRLIQFACRAIPALFCEELRLTANEPVRVEIEVGVGPEATSSGCYATDAEMRSWASGGQGKSGIDAGGAYSYGGTRLGIAVCVEEAADVRRISDGRYVADLDPGKPQSVRIIASMVSEHYHREPHLQAIRLARWGELLGYEELRASNRAAWSVLWRSRIVAVGSDPEDQRALDAAFYYYHANLHEACTTGYPPFGLTQSDKYYGHVFWDMDTWMLIPAILTAPRAAKALVEYRRARLSAALANASLFGYRGAQYPWESGLSGDEVTPAAAETGWAEQHASPDVAVGAAEYQTATGDPEFLETTVWPILKNVAEWIASRGVFTERGFEVRHMMGPDEGISNLSNQGYFNLVCKMALIRAVEAAERLGREPQDSWLTIIDGIIIPEDPKSGVLLPFDPKSEARIFDPESGRFKLHALDSSTVEYSLGNLPFLFVHGMPVRDEQFLATWRHEERLRPVLKRLRQNTVGFTLPAYAACAAYAGERDKALALFRASWEDYWLPPFGMIREMPAHNYGCFVTSCGSLLQSTLLGFTGLRLEDDEAAKHPASLPSGWTAIEVEQISLGGRCFRLRAVQGRVPELTPVDCDREGS